MFIIWHMNMWLLSTSLHYLHNKLGRCQSYLINHYLTSPTITSLISQSFLATKSSVAFGRSSSSLQSPKYFPDTPSTSGEVAKYTDVCAPSSGVLKKAQETAWNTGFIRVGILMCLPRFVRTIPGWREFTVTPVPSKRLASSLVYKMLASLLRL